MTAPLWFNSQISRDTLYFSDWEQKGIQIVGDLVNENGEIKAYEQIKHTYGVKFNILNYYRIRGLLKVFIKKHKKGEEFSLDRPHILGHVHLLYSKVKGSRLFYLEQNKHLFKESPLCESRWDKILSNTKSDEKWTIIYKSCFCTLSDNYIKWFQYKIFHQILGTRDYLFRLKLTETKMCRFCSQYPETVRHLFSECVITNELWSTVSRWIQNKLNLNLPITEEEKILGFTTQGHNFVPFNFLLLHTRRYIFWCAYNQHKLNFYMLQKILTVKYTEEKNVAQLNSSSQKFNHVWRIWKNLIE